MSKKFDSGFKYIRNGEIEIYYDTFGTPDEHPILLLCGLNTQLTHWNENFCKKLAKRGHYVVRFDSRDVGLSTNFTNNPNIVYTLEDMAEDTIQLINELGFKRVSLVGKSMGGLISQIVAARNPERIKSITLITTNTNSTRVNKISSKMKKYLDSHPINPLQDLEHYTKIKTEFARLLNGSKYEFDEKLHSDLAVSESIRNGKNNGGYNRQIRAVKETGDVSKYSKNIKCPVLIIHGSEDPVIHKNAIGDFSEKIKHSKQKIYEGMGHLIPKELYKKITKEISKNTTLSSKK